MVGLALFACGFLGWKVSSIGGTLILNKIADGSVDAEAIQAVEDLPDGNVKVALQKVLQEIERIDLRNCLIVGLTGAVSAVTSAVISNMVFSGSTPTSPEASSWASSFTGMFTDNSQDINLERRNSSLPQARLRLSRD